MTDLPRLSVQGSIGWGDHVLLPDLDFCAPAGQWTCMLGASGVGKSTLLRLFAGLRDGITVTGQMQNAGDDVAMMAQTNAVLPWLTALDNVLIGARLRGERPDRDRALAMLDKVGLRDHADKKPHHLSGGQRQRVALARVLMENRSVVLLDEPFSALDAVTRSQMQDLAAEVLRAKTVLMVTHDPAEAVRLAQKIVILKPDGLDEFIPPAGDTPRPIDGADVLRCQADLFKILRNET